jgi:hypothetical protein
MASFLGRFRADTASLASLAFAAVAFAACGTTIYVGAGGAGNATTTTVGSTGNGGSASVGPGPGTGAAPIVGPGVGAGPTSSQGGGAGPTVGPSTSTSASTGSGPVFPCSPSALCTAIDKDCIGLASNAALTGFGLRMSNLDLTAPQTLTQGIVAQVLGPAMWPNDPTCNEPGQGTFNWLLQFDTTAGTLKTGGAKPVADPTMGYSFDNEILAGAQIAPVTYMAQVDPMGVFGVTAGQPLNMPIFLNAMGTSAVVLPLSEARFTMGQLSANRDCIGHYNAAGLDPNNSCTPDATHPLFIDGASLDALIVLEAADKVPVSAIGETLCVLLSGSAAMYGMPGTGTFAGSTVCKRDATNQIIFKGSWCSTTNQPATPTCADAEHLAGTFAASSVLITN